MKNTIVVVGSINMDIVLKVNNLPKTGETIIGNKINYIPGGKGANQAVAAKRLGSHVIFIGKVGNDDFGKQLLSYLKKEKIAIDKIEKSSNSSGLAQISVDDDGHNTIVVLPGTNFEVSKQYLSKFEPIIRAAKIVMTQYETPLETINYLFGLAKKYRITTILNPSPLKKTDKNILENVDYFIVNENELGFFTDSQPVQEKEFVKASLKLQSYGVKNIIVTLGEKGVLAVTENKSEIRIKGIKVNVVDTTAAGDCFTGALAAKLANNVTLKQALAYANKAASISVTRLGASSSLPYKNEVRI